MQQHHGSQKAAAIGGGPTTPGLLLPRGPRGSPTPLQRGSGSGRGTPTTTGTHTPAASDLDTDTESGTQSDADFAAAGLASSSSTPRHQRAASGEFYVAPGEDLSELLRRTASKEARRKSSRRSSLDGSGSSIGGGIGGPVGGSGRIISASPMFIGDPTGAPASSSLCWQAVAEQEEEAISMRLIRRMNELRQEKEELLLQVEREEEHLTNTLSKKLDTMRQEKVDLENTLEHEQENVTNRLQKQLDAVREEKRVLETRLQDKAKGDHLGAHTGKAINTLAERISDVYARVHTDMQELTAVLQEGKEVLNAPVAVLQEELKGRQIKQHQLEDSVSATKRRNDGLTEELRLLRAESTELEKNVRIERERQRRLSREMSGSRGSSATASPSKTLNSSTK